MGTSSIPAYMHGHRLSHDRLEQNLTMLLKKVTENATTPAQNPSNWGPLPQTPTPHQPLAWRMAKPPDTPVSITPVSVAASDPPDVLPHELEKSASQSNNSEDADFHWDNSSSEAQHQAPFEAEEEVKATDFRGQLTPAESFYQRLRANGNSFQINGDVGELVLWSHRNNTYVDVVAAGNSIQLNGNVLDPTNFLNAVKC